MNSDTAAPDGKRRKTPLVCRNFLYLFLFSLSFFPSLFPFSQVCVYVLCMLCTLFSSKLALFQSHSDIFSSPFTSLSRLSFFVSLLSLFVFLRSA